MAEPETPEPADHPQEKPAKTRRAPKAAAPVPEPEVKDPGINANVVS